MVDDNGLEPLTLRTSSNMLKQTTSHQVYCGVSPLRGEPPQHPFQR